MKFYWLILVCAFPVEAQEVLLRVPQHRDKPEKIQWSYGLPLIDRMALEGHPPLWILRQGKERPQNPNQDLSESLADTHREIRQWQAKSQRHLPFGIDYSNQPSVQEYLSWWTHGHQKTLKVRLKRSGRWRAHFKPIFDAVGVPRDILYVAMIESGFKNRVHSHANAGGMWQFIPSTAMANGLKINDYVDERYDPIKATWTAAKYLKKQYERFGSWPLAMAAYNAGSGTVSKAISLYQSNDYFKLLKYGALYRESREYVPKILAAALIGENLEAFGLKGLVLDAPWSFETIEVPGNLRLSLLADAAQTDVQTLRALNPELIKDQTPPNVDHYILRIPLHRSRAFVERLDKYSRKYGQKHLRYRVKFGQSIEAIADQYGLPYRILRHANGLKRGEEPPYGSEIFIPIKGKLKKKAPKALEPQVVIVPNRDFRRPNRIQIFYKIQKGDDIQEIARHFDLSVHQLCLWNDLDPLAKLPTSLWLQIFVPKDFDLSETVYQRADQVRILVYGSKAFKEWLQSKGKSTDRHITYKVKQGDTLSHIARRYGVSVKNLIRWNHLSKNGNIQPGMRLVIINPTKGKKKRKKKHRR